ncbi:MAG: sigma-54-dependent transcriptional regulator [Terriglobales bacterium]
MKLPQILLVTKDRSALDLPWASDNNPGWQLEMVGSGWEALERLQSPHKVDLILFDLASGDSDGLHILRWLRRVRPDLPVLVLASSDDPNQKLEAIRMGAQEFLVRPWRLRQLESAIRRFIFHSGESPESEIGADEIEQIGDDMFFVAASPTMRKLRAQAELLAQVNDPVFILGENGSGKDLAACLIHKLSVRSGFRLLKLNCATLPGDVLESELFGGTSTNGRRKPGKLELCQRGTLFLDEITEMPLGLQAKLLHILREGYFIDLGSQGLIDIDVRIVAASQVNLEQAIADRRLREDLYYRLSSFTVHVPALRQRKEEIPLLLGHFMNRLARRYNLPTRIFSAAALEACQRHSWPGNLRELEKFVKRYLIMGDDDTGVETPNLDLDMAFSNSYLPDQRENGGSISEVPAPLPGATLKSAGLKSLVQSVQGEVERSAIASALDQARWNRKAAARLLKVSYRTLLYKIEHYNMAPPTGHLSGYGNGGSYRERNLNKG